MNPYYQQQNSFFPQSPPNQPMQPMPQTMQQPMPQQMQQFPYPQPMAAQQNPNFNIQALYTSVQPYNSEQFLLNTFGNKIDYIKVFLTLSHEDKLMMYMLTEERKLYGEIRDKQNYQRLLKEIAQKVQNYNLFHNNSQKKEGEDKGKELENKIDDFVEKTFEKFNANAANQENNTPNKNTEIVLTEQDIDEEEWVQSVQ